MTDRGTNTEVDLDSPHLSTDGPPPPPPTHTHTHAHTQPHIPNLSEILDQALEQIDGWPAFNTDTF